MNSHVVNIHGEVPLAEFRYSPIAPMMEAGSTSETSVNVFRTTRSNNVEETAILGRTLCETWCQVCVKHGVKYKTQTSMTTEVTIRIQHYRFAHRLASMFHSNICLNRTLNIRIQVAKLRVQAESKHQSLVSSNSASHNLLH